MKEASNNFKISPCVYFDKILQYICNLFALVTIQKGRTTKWLVLHTEFVLSYCSFPKETSV